MVGYDTIVSLLRYCTEVHEIDHPRTLLPAEDILFLIIPYLRVYAFVLILAPKVSQNGDELLLGQVTITIRTFDDPVCIVHIPTSAQTHPHDRLREDIPTILWSAYAIDVAAMCRTAHHCALDEIVRVEDKESPLRDLSETVTGTSDPLQ